MTEALKKAAGAGLILAAGVFAFQRLNGPAGIPGLFEKMDAIRRLEYENEQLRKEVDHRRQRNLDLQRPDVMELEIRKRLEMSRPGETDFKLPEAPASK